jgi:hypothetical protein
MFIDKDPTALVEIFSLSKQQLPLLTRVISKPKLEIFKLNSSACLSLYLIFGVDTARATVVGRQQPHVAAVDIIIIKRLGRKGRSYIRIFKVWISLQTLISEGSIPVFFFILWTKTI